MAAKFAASFGSSEWASLAGRWHDAGKYAADFQAYIRSANGAQAHIESHDGDGRGAPRRRVDHSSAGAVYAWDLWKIRGLPIAWVIAGHHAGLANRTDLEALRLKAPEKRARLEAAHAGGWRPDAVQQPPNLPEFLALPHTDRPLDHELWVRMLFSALVDADFLDTESFFDLSRPTRRSADRGIGPSISDLHSRLADYLDRKTSAAAKTPVNQMRADLLRACREAAKLSPGNFSLTSPTGSAKTLNSLAFALAHAQKHGLTRVIVVVPYQTLVEQTAQAYRDALGEDAVVEHHGAIDPAHETAANRVACENWDAPIIITTNVQFLESLFANRPSKCRKLHNIANGVVVFDEMQSIRPGILQPVLDVCRTLQRHFRVSILLASATQPGLNARPGLLYGFDGVREIASDPVALASTLRRVEVIWPSSDAPTQWPDLARAVVQHGQVLAITHLTKDARRLLAEVDTLRGDTTAFHLSAKMCPDHRSSVLREIKRLLARNMPVVLISTQVVEIGVDIDFPDVFRAKAGLDTLNQAAGRCNREGKLAMGRLHIYIAPTSPPPGILRQGLNVTDLMTADGARPDIFSPTVIDDYFTRLRGLEIHDDKNVQRDRREHKFQDVAENFRVIDEERLPVVVPYGDGDPLAGLSDPTLSRLEKRDLVRKAMRRAVQVRRRTVETWRTSGVVETVSDTIDRLAADYRHLYDDRLGLDTSPGAP